MYIDTTLPGYSKRDREEKERIAAAKEAKDQPPPDPLAYPGRPGIVAVEVAGRTLMRIYT